MIDSLCFVTTDVTAYQHSCLKTQNVSLGLNVDPILVDGTTDDLSVTAICPFSTTSTISSDHLHRLCMSLRVHGMADSSLHIVFRAVVVAKLTYAASAWWGFASAADCQRIEAVLRHGKRSGLCSGDSRIS